MPLVLRQTVAPTVMPVSRAEAKSWLRIDGDELNDEIDRLIEAATLHYETDVRRQLINATYTLQLDRFPPKAIVRYSDVRVAEIKIPRPPLSSVTSITYLDPDGASQTLGATIYTVDTASEPGRVFLAVDQSWPNIQNRPNAVTITFVAGYGAAATAVPEDHKTAILSLICHWHTHGTAASHMQIHEVPIMYRTIVWANKVKDAA